MPGHVNGVPPHLEDQSNIKLGRNPSPTDLVEALERKRIAPLSRSISSESSIDELIEVAQEALDTLLNPELPGLNPSLQQRGMAVDQLLRLIELRGNNNG